MKNLKINQLSKFKKAMILYAGIFLIILSAILLVFNLFLKSYENSQPIHAVKAYVNSLDSKDFNSLCEPIITDLNDKIQSKEQCLKNIKDILSSSSYAYNATDSSKEEKFYVLQANKKNVVNLSLMQGKKDIFGFSPWYVSSSELIKENITTTKVLSIPSDYSIKINESTIDSSFVTNTSGHYGMINGFYDEFDSLPTLYEYTIGPYVGNIDVIVVDPNNVKQNSEDFDHLYYFDNCTEEEKTEIKSFAEEFVSRYVNFTTGTDYNTSGRLEYLMEIVDSNSSLAERLEYTMGLGMIQEHSDTIKSIDINKYMNCGDSLYCADISYEVETISKNGNNNNTYSFKLLIEKRSNDELIAKSMSVE